MTILSSVPGEALGCSRRKIGDFLYYSDERYVDMKSTSLLGSWWVRPGSALAFALGVMSAGVAAAANLPEVTSTWETTNNAWVSRDCGYSQLLPSGKSFWLFCDSQFYTSSGQPLAWGFVSVGTAAAGPVAVGQVPSQLVELPSPPASLSTAGPGPFLPLPTTPLHKANGVACTTTSATDQAYSASWATGVAQEPSNSATLLITYSEVCVHNGTPMIEGLALIEYNSATNAFTGGPWEVFPPDPTNAVTLPPEKQLGAPVFSGGYLYLYGGECTTSSFGACTQGKVFLTSVLPTSYYWKDPTRYWWKASSAPTGWSHTYSDATSIITGATPAVPPTVVYYPGNGQAGSGILALMVQTNLSGGYQIWKSSTGTPNPTSWTLDQTASSLSGCASPNTCRALNGHSELSTSSQLLLSYFSTSLNYDPYVDPNTGKPIGDTGHLTAVSVPW